MDGFLAKDQTSLRNQILSRYPGFYSKEVRMLLKMVESDPRSTTCQNLRYLRKVTKLENSEQYSSWRIRKELPLKYVPEPEKWRLGLLTDLMAMQQNGCKTAAGAQP